MKKIIINFLILGFSFSFVNAQETSPVKIINQSSWNIKNIYASPVTSNYWGSNLIDGDQQLAPKQWFTTILNCANYDLRIVDEFGEECTIRDVYICEKDENTFYIKDEDLKDCH